MTAQVLEALVAPLAGHDQTPLTGHAIVDQLAPSLVETTPVAPVRSALARFSRTYMVIVEGASDLAEVLQADDEHPAVLATRDLEQWLQRGRVEVLALVGLRESTYYWWVEHPRAQVRPGKAGRLLRLHATLDLLVGQYGADRARLWLDEVAQAHDATSGKDGFLTEVERQATAWLAASRRPRRHGSGEARWRLADQNVVREEAAQLAKERVAYGVELEPEEEPER